MPGASGASQQGTPQLGGTKQDTGWSSLGGNFGMMDGTPQPGTTSKPNVATAGSSPFGYSYTLPTTVNPGNLFGGGTYDGIGGYDASTDRQVWDSGRGDGSKSNTRDTMLRWFLDDMRKAGVGDLTQVDPNNPNTDPQKLALASSTWATEVARMRRDFAANGYDWQQSGFAGYDKYLAGGQGGTGQGAPGGAAGQTPQISTQGQSGGSGLIGGQAGQGGSVTPNDPLNPYNTPNGSTGTQPGGATNPATTPQTTPTGNSAAPMGGYYSTNPGSAVTQFLGQHNVGISDHNPWAEFLRNLATGIATPIISTLPTGANGQPSLDRLNNLPQMLSDMIYGNGGHAFQNIANYGNTIQSQWTPDKLGTMTAPTVEKLLASIRAFETLGDNPYMQQFNQQALSDLFSRYEQAVTGAAQSGGKAPNPNWLVGNQQADPFGLFR